MIVKYVHLENFQMTFFKKHMKQTCEIKKLVEITLKQLTFQALKPTWFIHLLFEFLMMLLFCVFLKSIYTSFFINEVMNFFSYFVTTFFWLLNFRSRHFRIRTFGNSSFFKVLFQKYYLTYLPKSHLWTWLQIFM